MAWNHGDDDDNDKDGDTGSSCDREHDDEHSHDDNDIDLIHLDNFDEFQCDPPILTSPRSIEACRMQGIEPEDLVMRPVEFFVTHSVHTRATNATIADDPAFAEKRAARYEKNRLVLLRNARAQRYELMDAGLHGVHSGMSLHTRSFCRSPIAAKLSMSRHNGFSSSVAMQQQQQHQQAFSVIEREQRELERIQQRQVAEMQQLLAFELQTAELHDERERIEREKKRQDELLHRERLRRQRTSEEHKRRRDLERAEQHKLELEQARRAAADQQTATMRKEERMRREDERRRRDAQQADRERARRNEEKRVQAERAQLEQLRDVAAKEREIAQRDEQRRQQLELTKQRRAHDMAEKQQRNKLRITSVLQDKELLQAQQQHDAARKQQLSDARRQQFERERQQREHATRVNAQRKQESIEAVQLQLQSQEETRRAQLLAHERDAALRLQQREHDARAEREAQRRDEQQQADERRRTYERMEAQQQQRQAALVHRADAKAAVTQRMLAEKRDSVRVRLHDAKVREEEIEAALARKERQDVYRNELLRTRIESDNARAAALKLQREQLVRRRQQLQQRTGRQKHEILESFYRMKVTKKLALPPHLAATLTLSTADPRMRPQSAAHVLQTQSLSACESSSASTSPSTRLWPNKPRVKRPASAVGSRHDNSNSVGGAATRKPLPLHPRRYSETSAFDADGNRNDKQTQEEDAANASALDAAIVRTEIDTLRHQQNEALLAVLQAEHHAEEQREHLIALACDDAMERERIERIFNHERALASDRILTLTQQHERTLAKRIRALEKGITATSAASAATTTVAVGV